MWSWLIGVSLGLIVLGDLLFVGGWLYGSHQIRFNNGYDRDLETDVKAIEGYYEERSIR